MTEKPTPRLHYQLTTVPFPLQASSLSAAPKTATLTITAVNPHSDIDAVDLRGIEVQIPVGTDAVDLTDQPASIALAPAGWKTTSTSQQEKGGLFVFNPINPPATVAGDPLEFVFEDVAINTKPGPTEITVTEGSNNCEPPNCPVVKLPASKFPSGWGEVTFRAEPPDLKADSSGTRLHWDGPDGATYTVDYIDDGDIAHVPRVGDPPLQNSGTYPYGPEPFLKLSRTTVFTLTVKDNVSGKCHSAQKQVTVSVAAPSPKIVSFLGGKKPPFRGRARMELSWQFEQVDSFELVEEAGARQARRLPVPQEASSYEVTPTIQSTRYIMTAKGKKEEVSSSVKVELYQPVPVGTIVAYYAEKLTEDKGWLMCDGGSIDTTRYARLKEVIGSPNVPDLRGYFLRGLDKNGTVDPEGIKRKLGDIQPDLLAEHSHVMNTTGDEYKGSGTKLPYIVGHVKEAKKTDTNPETRPINIAVNYIIYAGVPVR